MEKKTNKASLVSYFYKFTLADWQKDKSQQDN